MTFEIRYQHRVRETQSSTEQESSLIVMVKSCRERLKYCSMFLKRDLNEITGRIIKCAIEVHKELGPGLMESVYATYIRKVMKDDGLKVESQVIVPVCFKGEILEKIFIIDELVEDEIILELKSVEAILPIHEAQLLTYLKLTNKKLGLLINFNVVQLKDGLRRRINGYLKPV